MEEGLNGVLADENKLITSADSCRLTVLPITRENMAITSELSLSYLRSFWHENMTPFV